MPPAVNKGMDHYANLVFVLDAMFLALNQVAGESQEMADRSDSCLCLGES
jgi:hypothetical protein